MPELTPEAQRSVDATVSFARELIEPQAEGWERNGGLPREFFQQAADVGLCGIMVPQALGGWGLSTTARARCSSAWRRTISRRLLRSLCTTICVQALRAPALPNTSSVTCDR